MSHPFPRGFFGPAVGAGLLASGRSSPRLPGRSAAQWLVRSERTGGETSPVTVAGPRRNRTGFPCHRPLLPSSVPRGGNEPRSCQTRDRDRQPDPHLHAPRRRRRDPSRRLSRVEKTHPRIEAYGDGRRARRADRRRASATRPAARYDDWLARLQNDLFDVGADVSVPAGGERERERLRVAPAQTAWLESICDDVNATLEPLKLVRAAGAVSPLAAQLHVCRTVCRRAERRMIALAAAEEIGEEPVALSQPAERPPLHPRARRERRGGRRRALGARAQPLRSATGDVSDAGRSRPS